MEKTTYAVKHKDKEVVSASRSGGIFTALSDFILNEGGVVYGCILNDNFEAIHTRADSIETRNKMRGSKYVQSKIGDCFNSAKKDLLEGRKVLFSGTSCQIAGLRSFLQKDYDNLLWVDIVCHGVPSPKVWKKYLEYLGNVKSVDFRNKTDFGWREHIETIETDNGKLNSKIWTNIFYNLSAMRPSCYKCIFKPVSHPSDITIADYWGIEKAAPEFDDNKGVSLVIINTSKGADYFESVKQNIIWKKTDIENSWQQALIKPYPRPKNRDKFWKDFSTKDFAYIARKYGGQHTLTDRVIIKVKNIVKRLFKVIGLKK